LCSVHATLDTLDSGRATLDSGRSARGRCHWTEVVGRCYVGAGVAVLECCTGIGVLHWYCDWYCCLLRAACCVLLARYLPTRLSAWLRRYKVPNLGRRPNDGPRPRSPRPPRPPRPRRSHPVHTPSRRGSRPCWPARRRLVARRRRYACRN
jgi:hypothetical protein